MKWTRNRIVRTGGTSNEAVAAQLAAAKRRLVLKIVVVANVVALLAAIAGCLFMVRSSGVKTSVEKMRDEIGEALTMMTLGSANEAVAKHLPRLIDTAARWDSKFAERRESFRGLDKEINHVQAMHRLGEMAERWHKELEGVSPTQRGDLWQKSLKAQVEAEQKKWPNRTHKKGSDEWLVDLGK